MTESTAFGHYRLLERLGAGGAGEVWKALDLQLERTVALKLLREGGASREALLAEAKTACRLQHPNVAVVFEAGEADGRPYMAMELVEGLNLRVLAGRSAPVDLLARVALQAARGLAHAHGRGIVHRDIKPENLAFTADGTLKILDFGIARQGLAGSVEATLQQATWVDPTRTGISLGTPAYMSPEQANGLKVGPATDQFSLGAVLWELAVGQRAFGRATLVDTLHAVAREELPPVSAYRPDLPPALAEVVDRLLAKRPEDRFASMEEAAQAVAAALKGAPAASAPELPPAAASTVPVPAAASPAARRRWALPLAAALLLGAGAAAWRLRRPVPAPDGRRRVVAILPLETAGLEAAQGWVGVSLQDAMGMGLVRRGDLTVLDRLRVAEAVGRAGAGSFQRLVSELRADLLVQGRLLAVGDRLRLSVRVLRGSGEVMEEIQVQGGRDGLPELEDELVRRLPDLFGQGGAKLALDARIRARGPRTRELYAKGLDLMGRGNLESYDVAAQLFAEAARQEPDYAPVHAGQAWALLELGATESHVGKGDGGGRYEAALAAARRAVALDPSLAFGQRELAAALLRQGELDGAKAAAQAALALDPADFRSEVVLGDAFAYRDAPVDRAAAKAHYERALDLAPEDWFAHFRYGVFLQNEGALAEALLQEDRARQLQPSAEYAHLAAALCRLWSGDPSGAAQDLDAGLRQASGARLLKVTQALAQLELGRREEALRLAKGMEGFLPKAHPISVLMEGVAARARGGPSAPLWRAWLERCKAEDWAARPVGERRAASVNLYHMARITAPEDPALAAALLDEAERLHPGKRALAKQDPKLKGLG